MSPSLSFAWSQIIRRLIQHHLRKLLDLHAEGKGLFATWNYVIGWFTSLYIGPMMDPN